MAIITGSYITNGVSGIWNSYGCPIQPGEGLYLYVEDTGEETESLADLVGFDRATRDIGLLKDKQIVSELVVMLPMIQKQLELSEEIQPPPKYVPQEPCIPCEEKTTICPEDSSYEEIREYLNSVEFPNIGYNIDDVNVFWQSPDSANATTASNTTRYINGPRDLLKYCVTEDAWLFTINEQLINKILGVENYKKLSIDAVKIILDTKQDLNHDNSVVKLMRAMVKYNFPPHLNWLAFPDKVPPYGMYVVEFSTVLDKNDLSNIWQGTMPRIAQQPDEEEVTIEYFLTDEEIFGGFDVARLENVKLSVFKCKMRAANDYKKMIKQTKVNALGQQIYQLPTNWYQYNWPYDNFSLVELLKIEGGEIRDYTSEVVPTDNIQITVDSGGEQSVVMQNVPYKDWEKNSQNISKKAVEIMNRSKNVPDEPPAAYSPIPVKPQDVNTAQKANNSSILQNSNYFSNLYKPK